MKRVITVSHPLIQDKLIRLRDVRTGSCEFRALLRELTALMTFEVTRDLSTEKETVETPLGTTAGGEKVSGELICVPVLRAGLGMVEGVLEVMPGARVGHVGIYRDPATLMAIEYYHKLPSGMGSAAMVLIVDPMLATGHTTVSALDICRRAGAVNLRVMCLVAAPEGISEVRKFHRDVPIFTAALDERLDSRGYILPGLGDAGDRIFGTK